MDHYCTAEYESTDEAVNILCALFGLLRKKGGGQLQQRNIAGQSKEGVREGLSCFAFLRRSPSKWDIEKENKSKTELVSKEREKREVWTLSHFFVCVYFFLHARRTVFNSFLLLEAILARRKNSNLAQAPQTRLCPFFFVSIPRHWSTTPKVPIPSSSLSFSSKEWSKPRKKVSLDARGQDIRYWTNKDQRYLKDDFKLPFN